MNGNFTHSNALSRRNKDESKFERKRETFKDKMQDATEREVCSIQDK